MHHALVLTRDEFISSDDVDLSAGLQRPAPPVDISRPFRDLKRELVECFEREYTRALLRHHRGNFAAASRDAGMDRKNLWSLAKKYEIDVEAMRQKASEE